MKVKTYPSDIAFTPSVKARQTQYGSRRLYSKMEQGLGWETAITPECGAFVSQQTSVFLATATAEGQPYIQHRGGPPGFLHVVDGKTITFADFAGNQQFVTLGNLTENPKAFLFMVDYVHRRRIKFWGTATVSEDPQLIGRFTPRNYLANVQRVILFRVATWEVNCSQHIPQRFDGERVREIVAEKDARIRQLEEEVECLKARVSYSGAVPPETRED
jgi:predicted pyridoxine 5'-phosphate oxidase superfamily flavin-nucleotide-binding protein